MKYAAVLDYGKTLSLEDLFMPQQVFKLRCQPVFVVEFKDLINSSEQILKGLDLNLIVRVDTIRLVDSVYLLVPAALHRRVVPDKPGILIPIKSVLDIVAAAGRRSIVVSDAEQITFL